MTAFVVRKPCLPATDNGCLWLRRHGGASRFLGRKTGASLQLGIGMMAVRAISRSSSLSNGSVATSALAKARCQQPAFRPIVGSGAARMLASRQHYFAPSSSRSSGSYQRADGNGYSKRLLFGRHVREALANGEPIVALESTVITHGLPQPQNLQLALSLEREIRRSGSDCTPATVGIIKGQIVVGLSEHELDFLADLARSRPIKASRRDIPIALARGLSAGTTVAATMAIAASISGSKWAGENGRRQSGIHVFATGGTGGVHRGGELSMDISADLYEFARSPMGVVSSGFKSFLDTRRSLEFLETLGCTVVSLQVDRENVNTNEALTAAASASAPAASGTFPAFYSRDSGVKSPFSVGSVQEAAQILFQCLEAPLGERRGMLLANPIGHKDQLVLPSAAAAGGKEGGEEGEVPNGVGSRRDNNLDDLLADISAQIDKRTDLEGKEKTPLILEQINRQTGGKSLEANVELLKNNARVGARLAEEYARILNRIGGSGWPAKNGE